MSLTASLGLVAKHCSVSETFVHPAKRKTAMTVLRNTVLTLLRVSGHTQIAKALRFFAAHPWQALNIIENKNLTIECL